MTKYIFKIDGLHCNSCALNVEWALEDIGVKAKCSYAKAELEVECPENLPIQKVREVVEKEGYKLVTGN